MKFRRITSVLLAGIMAVSMLTGCGINKDATVAKFSDGREVSLGLVNFMCRYQQAYSDDMYTSYAGDEVWSSDLFGTGSTMQEQVKDSVIEQVHELYTLSKKENMKEYGVEVTDEEKAAIKEATEKFMSDNSKDALDEMGATEEIVEEMLTLMTISSKMRAEIIKDADTNVSDEEANMRGYSQVKIDTTGTTDDSGAYTEYTDEQKADIEKKAKDIAKVVKTGDDLDTAVKDFGYEVTTGTYDADDESLEEDVKKALDDLKEGETSELVKTDSAMYVLRIDTDTDKEATEQNKESIIESRQDDKYNEVLEAWQKDDGWKVKDKLMEKIVFKNHFTQQDPNATEETETTETTGSETVDETQSAGTESAGTESVDTTEAQ